VVKLGESRDELIALGVALLSFAIVLFVPAVLNDADTYWHVTSGAWIVAHRELPAHDPFSYTFGGRPWQVHEWLSEVLMALAYKAAAWRGVVILCGLAAALTAGMLAKHLSRHLHGFALGIVLLLALACLSGSLLARPHLLALPLLEIWTASLVQALEARRTPSVALMPAMALWANLHASFLIGLGLIIPIAAASIADAPKWRALLRGWILFGIGALIASQLTPYGFDGLLLPFRLMSMPSLNAIGEWHAADFANLQPWELAIGVAAYVIATRSVRIDPFRAAILLGLTYLALAHVRHQVLLGIIGPLVLAGPLGQAIGARIEPASHFVGRVGKLVFATAMGVLITARLLVPLNRGDGVATPGAAFAYVPAAIAREPVLNEYSFGGFLIFNNIKPFIDSRAELYGESFLERYARLIRPDANELAHTLSEYRVGWTMFAPGNRAVVAMDKMPGWKRLYADNWAVVHVRSVTVAVIRKSGERLRPASK
jgi:hypothetical protein